MATVSSPPRRRARTARRSSPVADHERGADAHHAPPPRGRGRGRPRRPWPVVR